MYGEVRRQHSDLIADLASLLGVRTPETQREAEDLIDALDEVLASPDFEKTTAEDRAALIPRIAAFGGDFLVRRYGGAWELQDDPDVAFFGNAVITRCGIPVLAPDNIPFIDVGQFAKNVLVRRGMRKAIAGLGLEETASSSWTGWRKPDSA